MARETVVLLSDDLDGGEADETVRFSLDGRSYTIDLNEKNATALREAFAPYVSAASVDKGQRGPVVATVRTTSSRRHDVDAIRQWARSRGYEVSNRGRIAKNIQAEYDAIHS